MSSTDRDVPDRDVTDRDAAAIALASLPAMTPRRLRSLVHGRCPTDVIAAIESWSATERRVIGPLDSLLATESIRNAGRCLGAIWREALAARRAEIVRDVSRPGSTAQRVTVLGDEHYPRRLAIDPEAPGVLFSIGDFATLDGPRVGIVGTRHATAHGRCCARLFGRVLAAHGVGVVSGLARGIDISAHRGVLDHLRTSTGNASFSGRPIGAVASGLDVVYPPEHADEWTAVAETGLMLSESPPGTEPHAHRFPLRNRIIAALCDVLVVVESRATGGSMITVRSALERGVTVMAVPGSTSTRASEGTNRLIRDGALIAVEPEDVLAVLGLEAHRRSVRFDPRPRPSEADRVFLDVIGAEPLTLDHIVSRSGRDLADVALALGRLESQGWLMSTGGWFEQIGSEEQGDVRH